MHQMHFWLLLSRHNLQVMLHDTLHGGLANVWRFLAPAYFEIACYSGAHLRSLSGRLSCVPAQPRRTVFASITSTQSSEIAIPSTCPVPFPVISSLTSRQSCQWARSMCIGPRVQTLNQIKSKSRDWISYCLKAYTFETEIQEWS